MGAWTRGRMGADTYFRLEMGRWMQAAYIPWSMHKMHALYSYMCIRRKLATSRLHHMRPEPAWARVGTLFVPLAACC